MHCISSIYVKYNVSRYNTETKRVTQLFDFYFILMKLFSCVLVAIKYILSLTRILLKLI